MPTDKSNLRPRYLPKREFEQKPKDATDAALGFCFGRIRKDKYKLEMATNPPKGPGRVGAVRNRIQVFNPKIRKWTEIDTKTNLFINQKADGKKFKGVRRYT